MRNLASSNTGLIQALPYFPCTLELAFVKPSTCKTTNINTFLCVRSVFVIILINIAHLATRIIDFGDNAIYKLLGRIKQMEKGWSERGIIILKKINTLPTFWKCHTNVYFTSLWHDRMMLLSIVSFHIYLDGILRLIWRSSLTIVPFCACSNAFTSDRVTFNPPSSHTIYENKITMNLYLRNWSPWNY